MHKVALITGAARGIGRAIATGFAEQGASLALLDLDGPALDLTLNRLSSSEAKHRSYVVDVGDSALLRNAVEAILTELGRIDILINNAGIVQRRTLMQISEEEWDRIYAVNVKAAFILTQLVARHMIDRGGGGSIVNIASIAGRIARADKAHYASAKAALIHFSRCSAMELGKHGIRVNVVCPGPTDTDLIEHPVTEDYIRKHQIVLGKIAQPEDPAHAALFLCSPEAGHITGQVLHVDGGEVML